MAPTVQQLQTLFTTPSCQGCVKAANSQKPDIDLYAEGGGGIKGMDDTQELNERPYKTLVLRVN